MELDELNKLYEERTALEKEISEQRQVLIGNGVGMDEPLVDSEDYPLKDVNVYAVRIARANIIRLLNDFKNVNEKIRLCVQEQFNHNLNSPDSRPLTESTPNFKKLAIIQKIQKGSAVEYYGFREGDIILEFGSINGSNFKGLNDFSDVAKKSSGLLFKVVVERDGKVKRLNLKASSGLGCFIVPFQDQ